MTLRHRVIWSQGMFLQPHHFQQEARFTENLLDARVRAGQPYAWGFDELVLDESQLALGRVGVLRASGVMPDGTAFSIPDSDALPPALDVASDATNEVIYLAVPRQSAGITEVDFGDGQGNAASRYTVVDAALRDHVNAADDPEPVQLGAPRFQLLRARDATDAYALLGIARVVERRADAQVTTIAAMSPPKPAFKPVASSLQLPRCCTAWRSSAPKRSPRRWVNSATACPRSRIS